jgi:thioredoxin-dependent peroxiredoxin
MMIEAGQAAPDARFETAAGPKRVADYRGAPLVLYFYPKDDTPGCTKEAQAFTALAPEFAAMGVAIVGISKDSVASHSKFATKHALGITLGSDTDGSVCEAFGTWIEKSMYGRKYMGIERATFLIDGGGNVIVVWPKVKVAGHAEAVLAAAKAAR